MLKLTKTLLLGLMLLILIPTAALADTAKTFNLPEVVVQPDGREIQYFKEISGGKIFYNVPELIRTKTPSGNGTNTIRYDINGISNEGNPGAEHKIVDTGASVEVTNVVKEGEYSGLRMLYAKSPVTISFTTTEVFAHKTVTSNNCRYEIENGGIAYCKSLETEFKIGDVLDSLDGKPQQVTIDKPGIYHVNLGNIYTTGINFRICVLEGSEDLTYTAPKAGSAVASSMKLKVNGKSLNAPAYNINGSNYLKLRDIAYMVKDTPKKFNVVFSDRTGEPHVTMSTYPGMSSYQVTGSEMKPLASGVKKATPPTVTFIFEAGEVHPTAYVIDGSNYVKLKDIAQLIDFGVEYDNATGEVVINTAVGYK